MKLRPLSVTAACLAVLALLAKSRFELPRPGSSSRTSSARATSRTPAEYRRAPDNTFLTFPEWYLVYSPREYARFIVNRPPSQFPYLGHLGQFWQGYRAIYQATKDADPFNLDYHLMIWVIGISTTAEYGLKEAYETVVGRVAEASSGDKQTAEDRLAADVAREYVDFLDGEPWFNFDFLARFKRLWTTTGLWGDQPLRKWERKYFLTSEYLAKAAYGWVIKKSSESSFGVESMFTIVVLDRAPPVEFADVKVLERFPDGAVLAQLPRYQAFARAAQALARARINFLEIAGNKGPILVSAIVSESYQPSGVDVLFVQPIMTEPGRKRIAFTVNVPQLTEALRRLDDPQIQIEHIYDF
jgi:hypothetical protein